MRQIADRNIFVGRIWLLRLLRGHDRLTGIAQSLSATFSCGPDICPARERGVRHKRLGIPRLLHQHQHSFSRLFSTPQHSLLTSKMFNRFTTLVALALAAASPVLADHLVTITNNCGNAVTPMLTNTGGPFVQLATLGRGQSTTTILAEGVSTTQVSQLQNTKAVASGTPGGSSDRRASAASRTAADGQSTDARAYWHYS
jgi:hypothetical protein